MTTQLTANLFIQASEAWAKELLEFPEYSKADDIALKFVGKDVKVSPRLQLVICEVLRVDSPNKQIVGEVFCMNLKGQKMDGFLFEVNGNYYIDTKCCSFWTETVRGADGSSRFYPSRRPTIYI